MSNTKLKIETIRHSLAHILAMAVLELKPEAKLGMGPAIENGFYYDFDFADDISETDLPRIEEKMKKLIEKNLQFKKEIIPLEEAKKIFSKKGQPYKLEMIDDLVKSGQPLTIYRSGGFTDLCAGPHAASTKDLNPETFKLIKVAGAYFKGNENNPQLQRIYGAAFETEKELEKYLALLEEAKKRDHRKLGKELQIFAFSDEVGKGLPLWLPQGVIIREELEKWAKETEEKDGYLRVATPHIARSELYYTSGHLPHYAEDMYAPFKIEDEEYYLKPMNCPHHHMIYKTSPRSYRDLPLRLAEYAAVYRYERSGVLYGLMRARGFTQNDAHIYCRPDQAKEEFIKVMKMHEYYYKTLGIKSFYMELGLPDWKEGKKYHGDKKMWALAEKLTREAMKESKIPFVEKIGGAAFYGPKIDFIIETATINQYAISTNQLDLYMAERFGLNYTDEKGEKQTPAIIHRAPLGSHERFIGFLIEHFAGAFPIWLSPIQAAVLPISTKGEIFKYAAKTKETLKENGTRVWLDERNETLAKKIREAELQKIPYLLIIGDQERESQTLSVRQRGKRDIGKMMIEKFKEKITQEIKDKKL